MHPNGQMRSYLIVLHSLVFVFMMGCVSTDDVITGANGRTDLTAGQVYRLKTLAAIYRENGLNDKEGLDLVPPGYNKSPHDLDAFQRRATQNRSYAGVLMPGTLVKVVKVTLHHNRSFGDFLFVDGVIISGELKGTQLSMNPLLNQKPSFACAYVDPEYLELVK